MCFRGIIKLLTVVGALGVTGCIAPPIVTYASMAMDGASFLATGKSIGDHALSAAVDEDCALLRVVTEQDVNAVCREYASDEEREASIFNSLFDETEPGAITITVIEPDKVPPKSVLSDESYLQLSTNIPAKLPLTTKTVPTPETIFPIAYFEEALGGAVRDDGGENRAAIYLMIGNFSSVDGAESLAARVEGINAVVSPAMAGEASYFRVVAGPITPGETKTAQSRLAAMGIDNSWAANLCTRDLGAPPCQNP